MPNEAPVLPSMTALGRIPPSECPDCLSDAPLRARDAFSELWVPFDIHIDARGGRSTASEPKEFGNQLGCAALPS